MTPLSPSAILAAPLHMLTAGGPHRDFAQELSAH